MQAEELKARTKTFSLMILSLIEQLPNTVSGRVVANQLARCGTSVGANYRAVCRARSDREFIAKMSIVLEESDEALFWLEIVREKDWLEDAHVEKVWSEGNELTSIFVRSLKSIKARIKDS